MRMTTIFTLLATAGLGMTQDRGGPPDADRLFDAFDANGDDVLDQGEVPARVWLRLQAADGDGDGAVTLEELEKAIAKRRGGGTV